MKKLAGVGIGIALVMLGAGTAQAWTWASSSNPIAMTGGGGYGNLQLVSNQVTLQSWLRDTKVGDGRVYAHVRISNSNGVYGYFASGKRTDGAATYARMQDVPYTVAKLVGNYSYRVETCRGATLNDPCSQDKRYYP